MLSSLVREVVTMQVSTHRPWQTLGRPELRMNFAEPPEGCRTLPPAPSNRPIRAGLAAPRDRWFHGSSAMNAHFCETEESHALILVGSRYRRARRRCFSRQGRISRLLEQDGRRAHHPAG